MRFPLAFATILLCAAACQQATAPAAPSPGCDHSSKQLSPPAPSASASASSASAVTLPFELDRGCAEDIDPAQPVSIQLEHLQKFCAPGLAEMCRTEQASESASTIECKATLSAHACLRVAAASSSSTAVLDVQLTGPDGAMLLSEKTRAPAILPTKGPLCVRQEGSFTLRLRSASSAAGAVFAATPPASSSAP